jgi:hypothetical protein
MLQVQLGANNTSEASSESTTPALLSPAERELHRFVHSMCDLFSGELATLLAEVWLDEVASMDRIPEHESAEWRLVTVRAAVKLARMLLHNSCGDALRSHNRAALPAHSREEPDYLVPGNEAAH